MMGVLAPKPARPRLKPNVFGGSGGRLITRPALGVLHLAKGRLESEGVTVLVKGETEGPYHMGPMFLFVPRKFEKDARAIMASISELREGEDF